jgi:predicted regulator of Ras-like GTPase activity (Roadblock/LC7/MglB family)
LLKEVSSPQPQPEAPSPPPESVEQTDLDVQPFLAELARETHADVILLISYASGYGDVVAHFSVLDGASVKTLASLILEAVSAAQGAAQFLGQPNRPFEHNMFESESLRLYAMTLPQSLMLVVVAPASTPLGTIRHNLRRVGRGLADRALT